MRLLHGHRTAAATGSLLARFRRQRPLRGGSLIVTVFGDALAPRGGAIALASLIELVTQFGLSERLVRTSAARLAAEDWLSNRRVGRRSEYRLSARGRQRFAEATARIYSGPAIEWHGRWTLVVLSGLPAPSRLGLRRSLQWKGFGEIAPSVLAHPMVTPGETREYLAMNGLGEAPILLESRSLGNRDAARLVRRGWDLHDLESRYARFLRHYERIDTAVAGDSRLDPAAAFVVRTLLIHEYRRIHLRDPLLPRVLLPAAWSGAAAYDLCRRVYGRVCASAEQHLSAVGARLDGPLPAPDPQLTRRFPPLHA